MCKKPDVRPKCGHEKYLLNMLSWQYSMYIIYIYICMIEVFHLNDPLSNAGILEINVNVKCFLRDGALRLVQVFR